MENNIIIRYQTLSVQEVCFALFKDFIRYQVVSDCWRKENGKWMIKHVPFIDDWDESDYHTLIIHLQNTLLNGGFVYAAFYHGACKGFVSVEADLFGGSHRYLDMSLLFISLDMRKKGIGRTLFQAAKVWAKCHGADKLYISAHSAVETQAFYRKMGCVEAAQYDDAHYQREPKDCQLECKL